MRVRMRARTGAGTRQSVFSIGGAESHAANAKGSSAGADGPPPTLFSLRGDPAYDEPSAAAAAAAAAAAEAAATATTAAGVSLVDAAGRLAELQADVAAPLGEALANVAGGGGGAGDFREEAATGRGAGSAGVGAAGAGAGGAGAGTAGAANEELLLKS